MERAVLLIFTNFFVLLLFGQVAYGKTRFERATGYQVICISSDDNACRDAKEELEKLSRTQSLKGKAIEKLVLADNQVTDSNLWGMAVADVMWNSEQIREFIERQRSIDDPIYVRNLELRDKISDLVKEFSRQDLHVDTCTTVSPSECLSSMENLKASLRSFPQLDETNLRVIVWGSGIHTMTDQGGLAIPIDASIESMQQILSKLPDGSDPGNPVLQRKQAQQLIEAIENEFGIHIDDCRRQGPEECLSALRQLQQVLRKTDNLGNKGIKVLVWSTFSGNNYNFTQNGALVLNFSDNFAEWLNFIQSIPSLSSSLNPVTMRSEAMQLRQELESKHDFHIEDCERQGPEQCLALVSLLSRSIDRSQVDTKKIKIVIWNTVSESTYSRNNKALIISTSTNEGKLKTLLESL